MRNFNHKLEAPWYSFRKKVNAMFENDPDIEVGDIYEVDNGDYDYAFDIKVMNHEKFIALDRVLVKFQVYGNVTLAVVLFDMENSNEIDQMDVYRTLFDGNPIFKDCKTTMDGSGFRHSYVRFVPEVVQFFDDDLSDYNRNWNGLAEEIADEIFQADGRGVSFCTADKKENVAIADEVIK